MDMDTQDNKRTKAERLNSKKNIDRIFSGGESFVVYPYRIVYTFPDASEQEASASFFVSVPKKKFKRAVKRNLIRRRIKEAYRLNKALLTSVLKEENKHIAMAFLYLDREVRDYGSLEPKMQEMLRQLAEKIRVENPEK